MPLSHYIKLSMYSIHCVVINWPHTRYANLQSLPVLLIFIDKLLLRMVNFISVGLFKLSGDLFRTSMREACFFNWVKCQTWISWNLNYAEIPSEDFPLREELFRDALLKLLSQVFENTVGESTTHCLFLILVLGFGKRFSVSKFCQNGSRLHSQLPTSSFVKCND